MSQDKAKTIFVIDFNSIESHIKWIISNRVHNLDRRQFPSKLVKFDFQRCRNLKPYHIAPLACLIHEYQAKDYIVKLINSPDNIKAYLESFHFDQFCNKENINNFPSPTDPKTLPLWRIEKTATSVYPAQAQKYFENNHFNGKDLFALSLSLAELMNNVFDHSESKIPGYTFTQFNSSRNQIITCVCDFGIGIPYKVNHYLKQINKPTRDNLAALIKSFEINFSTLSKPHNRGFGWDNIFSNIKALRSKILIVSNNALYWILDNGSEKTCLLKGNFPGTSVVIYLDSRNLPLKEEELTDELKIF